MPYFHLVFGNLLQELVDLGQARGLILQQPAVSVEHSLSGDKWISVTMAMIYHIFFKFPEWSLNKEIKVGNSVRVLTFSASWFLPPLDRDL